MPAGLILVIMPIPSSRAFVLPYSLLLAATILIMATFVLEEVQHTARRSGHMSIRVRADDILRRNVQPLVQQLKKQVLQDDICSALGATTGSVNIHQSIGFHDGDPEAIALHSVNGLETRERVQFRSPVSDSRLLAGFQRMLNVQRSHNPVFRGA